MMELGTPQFWVAALQIILINILLSGDNAVVIALAARSLPARQQKQAILWGAGAAIVLQDSTRLFRFDELKNDLVATVAHEFRTPLTSLRMALHMITDGVVGPLTPKQADLLFAARDDCERLQVIVDELLNLSRIESGLVKIAKQFGVTVEAILAANKSIKNPDKIVVGAVIVIPVWLLSRMFGAPRGR